MKQELRKIRNEYATPRKTDIKEEITELKVDSTVMIPKEDVIVTVTKDGYVKRTSIRSYSTAPDEIVLKDNDYLLGLFELNTLDTVLLFTTLGNFLYVPVHEIPVCMWKDLGKHISNVIKLESDEKIVSAIPVTNFEENVDITMATRDGMIKRTSLKEFKSLRYTKPINCMKLKDKDVLLTAFVTRYNDIFIGTNKSYGLWFDVSEIPVVGLRTSGVKSINLKDDYIVSVSNFSKEHDEFLLVVTNKGTGKRVKLSEFEKTSRAKRGLLMLREVKANPYRTVKSIVLNSREYIGIKTSEIKFIKSTEFPIMDRYSTGSSIIKGDIKDVFIQTELVKKQSVKQEVEIKETVVKEKPSLKEIDDKLMTIDDFIDVDF